MRALIQRVSEASVTIGGEPHSNIGKGLLVFLGAGEGDTEAQTQRLWDKIRKLRIFEDEAGKTNLDISQVDGELMIVSQFTLYASCRKGNRPSFTGALEPTGARELYEHFVNLARADGFTVGTGEFGAMMEVSLVNDGPFTIWLDTAELT